MIAEIVKNKYNNNITTLKGILGDWKYLITNAKIITNDKKDILSLKNPVYLFFVKIIIIYLIDIG